MNPLGQENAMRIKAAIFRAPNQPLTVEEVEVDEPGPYEVLVRTVASGVCHSDLHCVHGSLPTRTPAILGHEPAGVVEAVGGGNVAEFATLYDPEPCHVTVAVGYAEAE